MITVGRKNDPGAVYIGRGSPLGNPFVMHNESQRDYVCDEYEKWFHQRFSTDDAMVLMIADLLDIARDGDLVLGCFCAPKRCHGDTIKRFLTLLLEAENVPD